MKSFLQKGLTLIELVIVIAVLGILASVLVVAINPNLQIERGHDAQRKSDISGIQTALEEYRHDTGLYPTAGFPPACKAAFSNNGVTYIGGFPCDPVSGTQYNGGKYYYNSADGTAYTMAACLQDPNATGTNVYNASSAPAGVAAANCTSGKYYIVQNQ